MPCDADHVHCAGAWRWFDDSLLDCCEDLSVVQIKGITMDKLACLGRCNGASVWARHADGSTFDEFVTAVEVATAGRAGPQVLIISYGRSVLNQTGTGHFSPIGAYDPKSRMVLMLGACIHSPIP
jgi:glutathione gamma-glutamylcysteinyltransferase